MIKEELLQIQHFIAIKLTFITIITQFIITKRLTKQFVIIIITFITLLIIIIITSINIIIIITIIIIINLIIIYLYLQQPHFPFAITL